MMACAKAITVISTCFPFIRVASEIGDLFNSKSKCRKDIGLVQLQLDTVSR